MSKGASLAPQEISMDFEVLPETNRQGLFNQFHKKFALPMSDKAHSMNFI